MSGGNAILKRCFEILRNDFQLTLMLLGVKELVVSVKMSCKEIIEVLIVVLVLCFDFQSVS